MTGETDLARLIETMTPTLAPDRYVFRTLPMGSAPPSSGWFTLIAEDEGVAMIASDPAGDWARITLMVYSSLEAVGLTATVATALAAQGISANMVAAFHHDHVFVPWDRRDDAMTVLMQLSSAAQ